MTEATPKGERVVAIRLAQRAYALRLRDVAGVAPLGELSHVPLAPAGVLGLCPWAGGVLTVLDLAELVDDQTAGEPGCLVRLAPPWGHAALFVAGRVRVESVRPGNATLPRAGTELQLDDGSTPHLLIDPATLVGRVESRLASRGP